MTGIMKRYLFGMPVVAMVIMVSMFCSCGNKGNTSQVQTTTDSVAVESIEAGDAPIDVKMVEKRLQEILSKLITEEGDVYLPECFTEGFKTYYTRACEKADKEGRSHILDNALGLGRKRLATELFNPEEH